MNFYLPFVVLLTLFLVSCSGGGTNVKLEVSHNFQFAGSSALQAVSAGGLMVWGKSSTGDSFAQSLENNDSINLNLSNGTWTFYAMAWDGSKDFAGNTMSPGSPYPLGGVQRCGISSPVTLNGAAASVDLSILNSTCTDPVFKGSRTTSVDGSGNAVLPPTTFSFCRGISNLTSGQDVCADAQNDVRQKERKAYIGSFKVKLKNYRNLGGSKSLNGEIASKCIAMQGDVETPPSPAPAPSVSDNSFYGASNTKIAGLPAGGPGLPFYIEVEMFQGNSKCDDTALGAIGLRGSLSKHLLNGVESNLEGSHKYFPQTNSSNQQLHKMNLQVTNESICQNHNGTAQDGHPFAGGEGTKQNPYLICSVPQFHAINLNSTYMTKHYRLASDLNFNPYSKGLAGGVVPTVFTCLEDGSNFIPIGYPNATCAGPGSPMIFNTPVPFTGSFMGSGYKISNLRLRAEEDDNIAMFAKIQTGTPPNDFGDISLDNIEISGKTNVGALVGDLNMTNVGDARFWQVYAKNLDIESRPDTGNSYVGALFGKMYKGSLDRAVVKKSSVRGDRSYVGGITGAADTTTLSEVVSEVNIDADSSSAISYVGGVAGYSLGSTFQYVKHEGGIYTNGMIVGGIVGEASTATNLTNFYSISFIYSGNGSSNLKIGGVVGHWDSTSSPGPGYTLSSIKSPCFSACQIGPVAGYATSSTSSIIYRTNSSESGEIGGASMSGEAMPSTGSVASMRTTTLLTSLPNSTTSDWNLVNGEYPRFDFENHPCTHGASGTGAGTLISPIQICHEGQFAGMTSSVYQLASNIRLSNVSTATNLIATFSGTLLGQGYSVLAGDSAATAANSGLIGTISSSGKIFNTKFLGLSRASTVGTTIADAHGVLAATNNGEINNVEFWSFGNFTKFGSLVVGKNDGYIRNIEVRGMLKANFEGSASIAVKNLNTIEDSKTQNSIDCNQGAGCSNVAGLVVVNASGAKILRTEMGTHTNEPMSKEFDGTLSMLVDDNAGLIEDVNVREYTDFRSANGGYYYSRVNTGNLNRVFNAGRLITGFGGAVTYAGGVLTGFPTITSAADPDTGTHTDVFRSGANSGKEILYEVSYVCSTADILTISAWSGVDSSWDTAFNTGYVADGQKLIIKKTDNSGYTTVNRVFTYGGSNTFGIGLGGCMSGETGKVSVYYSSDLVIDTFLASEAGVKLPQSTTFGDFSLGWQSVMWDDVTDRPQIFAYYAYLLGLTNPSPPPQPKIWRIEGSKLDLFKLD